MDRIEGLSSTGRGYGCALVLWFAAVAGALFAAIDRQLSTELALVLVAAVALLLGVLVRSFFIDRVSVSLDASGLRIDRRTLITKSAQELSWSELRGVSVGYQRGKWGRLTHATMTLTTALHGTLYLGAPVDRAPEVNEFARRIEAMRRDAEGPSGHHPTA